MVHLRLNERETNPNPHINFITALPGVDPAAAEDARQLMRALAAQVRPVMKANGFEVNSLEEYEHNRVFAGRNWNNGETIELVLRGAHGSFLPASWLMSTLCHELAHIKHMDHGSAFQALWNKLQRDVRELQAKGYFGDGYWSAGTRLADSARVGPEDLQEGDLPEYMCGGAQTRARPTRRVRRASTATSTGKRKRKPGTRVTSARAFLGAGSGEKVGGAEVQKDGFGRRAQSKRARAERAAAAERRLAALQAGPSNAGARPQEGGSEDEDEYGEPGGDEGEEETVPLPETDQDRRDTLLASMSPSDADGLKSSRQRFLEEFLLPSPGAKGAPEGGCAAVILPRTGSTAAPAPVASSTSSPQAKRTQAEARAPPQAADTTRTPTRPLSYGALVRDEASFRKKEAIGLAGGAAAAGRTVGGGLGARAAATEQGRSRLLGRETVPPSQREQQNARRETRQSGSEEKEGGKGKDEDEGREWSCLVCTLTNQPGHLACSACATPRGESSWGGDHT